MSDFVTDGDMVYAVFKHAVYRHECAGIFTEKGKARAVALDCLRGERDSQHCYKIVPFKLNENPVQTPCTNPHLYLYPLGVYLNGGEIEERAPVETFFRDNEGVIYRAGKEGKEFVDKIVWKIPEQQEEK